MSNADDEDQKPMTITLQDAIERQLVIPVARQRVWDAITQPDQIARWFCQAVSLELEPGAPLQLHWERHGSTRGRIETVEPIARFAYRWVPISDPDSSIPIDQVPSTLVEFLLEDAPEGTRLTVRESGFASLPEADRERALRDNTEGWIEETTHLLDYLVAEEAS